MSDGMLDAIQAAYKLGMKHGQIDALRVTSQSLGQAAEMANDEIDRMSSWETIVWLQEVLGQMAELREQQP